MTNRSGAVALMLMLALVACGSDPAGSGAGADATTLDDTGGADTGVGDIPDASADQDAARDVGADAADVPPSDDVAADATMDATADIEDASSPDADAPGPVDAGAPRICVPGSTECRDGSAATCSADGGSWDLRPCVGEDICVAGACVPAVCEPGQVLCAAASTVTCNADGNGFIEAPCPEGWACFDGACVACVRDVDCDGFDTGLEVCRDGLCVPAPVEIVTVTLPPAMIDVPWRAVLDARGGATPYSWTTAAGVWPAGVTLSSSGEVTGTPSAVGTGVVTVRVNDSDGDSDTAELEWTVLPEGISIVTASLPTAEEGFDYAVTLEAIGGLSPYAWMILEGGLPAGLTLSSDGRISGVPSEVGTFPILVRVFDRATPPGYADREFTLTVSIAPLRIVADTQYDLLITSVIVLPLMVPIEGIPVPYDQNLEARGGLRPYAWVETELAGAISFLIPNAGIPTGLTLETNGRLHGSVTDTSQVIRVAIPFTAIELTGFFFTAQVSDSQEPADSASAIYLIPTVPIGG